MLGHVYESEDTFYIMLHVYTNQKSTENRHRPLLNRESERLLAVLDMSADLGEDELMRLLDGIEAVISGPTPAASHLSRLESQLTQVEKSNHECKQSVVSARRSLSKAPSLLSLSRSLALSHARSRALSLCTALSCALSVSFCRPVALDVEGRCCALPVLFTSTSLC